MNDNQEEKIMLNIIEQIDVYKQKKINELQEYKKLKKCTKKYIENKEDCIYEIGQCNLIIKSIYNEYKKKHR